MNGAVEILAVSVAFSAVAAAMNRKLGNRPRLKEIQRELNQYQRELKEATKRSDAAALKNLKAREAQAMAMTKEMFILTFKPMLVVLPMFFLALWALDVAFQNFSIQLPIALHWNEISSLQILSPSTYGVRGFFIIVTVFSGIAIELALQAYEKINQRERRKDEKRMDEKQGETGESEKEAR